MPSKPSPTGPTAIHVALAFDANATSAALLAVRSTIASCGAPERLAFHLVSNDPSVPASRAWQRVGRTTAARLEFLSFDAGRLRGLRQAGHISLTGFARLLLPDLLPTLERVIYLDADLFVHRDVAELWQVDLEGHPIAAVADYNLPSVGDARCVAYASDELIDPAAAALNSGVLVLDLAAWRRERLSDRLLDFCRRHISELRQAEQDAFNAVLCGRWKALPPAWNVQLHALLGPHRLTVVPESLAPFAAGAGCGRAAVYHFTGAIKPWNGGPMHPAFGVWLDALAQVNRARGVRHWTLRAGAYARAVGRTLRGRLRRAMPRKRGG